MDSSHVADFCLRLKTSSEIKTIANTTSTKMLECCKDPGPGRNDALLIIVFLRVCKALGWPIRRKVDSKAYMRDDAKTGAIVLSHLNSCHKSFADGVSLKKEWHGTSGRHPLRNPDACTQSGFYSRCRDHACAWNRRKHGNL